MSQTYRFPNAVTRQLHKRVPDPRPDDPTRMKRVPDGIEVGGVELTIDWETLVTYIGRRALRNTSSRSRALNGSVRAKITKRTRHPEGGY